MNSDTGAPAGSGPPSYALSDWRVSATAGHPLRHDPDRQMRDHLRSLIAAHDKLLARMRGAEFAGEVRLGVPPDVVGALVPPVLRIFRERQPGVLVTLVCDGSRALHQALADGVVDLALATESAAADGDGLLLADRLVWVGAPSGDAHQRRPLPVALGREGCAFRTATVGALARAGVEWRAICQVGSLEPVFATLEADMAVGAFLSRTVPDRLAALSGKHSLPRLPVCYINLLLPGAGLGPAAAELATCLRERLSDSIDARL